MDLLSVIKWMIIEFFHYTHGKWIIFSILLVGKHSRNKESHLIDSNDVSSSDGKIERKGKFHSQSLRLQKLIPIIVELILSDSTAGGSDAFDLTSSSSVASIYTSTTIILIICFIKSIQWLFLLLLKWKWTWNVLKFYKRKMLTRMY